MATTWMKALHRSGGSIAAALDRTTDYIENPEKTNDGELITGFECDPFTAQSEFLFSKRLYEQKTGRDQGKNDVIAYHIRMSFKPGEVTAKQALELGRELAMRWTKGKHQFIVAAHTNTKNPHAHIVYNSVTRDCTHKFQDFKRSAIVLCRVSDQICLEHGLSVIENPGKSKGYNRHEYLGEQKPLTARERLCRLMDSVLPDCKDIDSFISALKAAGVEIKSGKQLSFRLPDSKKFTRQDTLGENYSENAILERISGKRIVTAKSEPSVPTLKRNKPSLLIDIQQKIQEGKGAGYEQWARIFNIKEMSRTLLFLQENKIDSYDELVQKSAAASSTFRELTDKIKAAEKRMSEISELQKYIGQYGKTREVYKQYLSAKNRGDFFEEHRAEVTLHMASKKYFDGHGYNKNNKVPKIADLKQEYAILLAEKRKLYSGYRAAKDNMIALATAKENASRMLHIKPEARDQDIPQTYKRRNHSYER